MDLEFHPLANCLPLIEGPEFDELVADIKERGLALPIELYDGKILDGRNRYRACLRLGIEPLIVTYAGADPAARVTSLNLRRRHLTASQRAMAAAKMANMRSGARTDLGHSLSEVSIKRAADSAQGRDNQREAQRYRLRLKPGFPSTRKPWSGEESVRQARAQS